MVDFTSITPGRAPGRLKPYSSNRRTKETVAAEQREGEISDRRRKRDRRSGGGAKQVMDRRSGLERRRPRIDLSV